MATNLTVEDIIEPVDLPEGTPSADDKIIFQNVDENELQSSSIEDMLNVVPAVRYDSQILTEEQKKQARNNITSMGIYFGITDTASDIQEKSIDCAGFELVPGVRISVKFTNGNTAGTAKGTSSNVIAASSAPTLNVNGTGAKTIYVGGEPAGEGFINSGDVHDFVYDGTNWCDVTADVIYKGGDDTDGFYEKKRNGLLTQFGKFKYSGSVRTFPIPFSNIPSVSVAGFSSTIGNSGVSEQYAFAYSVNKNTFSNGYANSNSLYYATGY